VSLVWSAPGGCPTESDVRAQALRLLAGPPIAAERRVSAVARVVRTQGGRWHVDVTMSSEAAQGKRSLEAESCSGLAEATALIVAIMVDPDRAGAAAAAASTSTALSPAAASSAPVTATPRPPSSPSPGTPPSRPRGITLRPRWAAGAWGLVDFGTLPDTAYGVGVGLAAVVGHLRSEVALSDLPGRSYTFPRAMGTGAEMSAWVAAGSFAYVVHLGRTELALGGGAEITHLDAFGVRASPPFQGTPGSGTWPALRAEAVLTTPIVAAVLLRLETDAVAPLRRPTFDIEPIGVVHQPSTITGRLGAGIEVQF
jgi:hypothetical protein